MKHAAAGCVQAAFGAPIGGVLFSMEEACTHWSRKVAVRCFVCTTVAVCTVGLLNPKCALTERGSLLHAVLRERAWQQERAAVQLQQKAAHKTSPLCVDGAASRQSHLTMSLACRPILSCHNRPAGGGRAAGVLARVQLGRARA